MADPAWLVSVHDVMPDTVGEVRSLVRELDDNDIGPVTFLVVPGGAWTPAQLAWLRTRQKSGDVLAGHGWRHRAGTPRGLYDRLHRRFFSRGVAEHLALDSDGIASVIERCFAWFAENDLRSPTLYVPPAWAMGSISRARLRELPFEHYETLGGVYHARDDRFERIPLLGFEADTAFRATTLRIFNVVNHALAKRHGRARVAIHPRDRRLLLSQDLSRLLG